MPYMECLGNVIYTPYVTYVGGCSADAQKLCARGRGRVPPVSLHVVLHCWTKNALYSKNILLY